MSRSAIAAAPRRVAISAVLRVAACSAPLLLAALPLSGFGGRECSRETRALQRPCFKALDLGGIEAFNEALPPGLGPHGDVVFWKRRSKDGGFAPVHWTEGNVQALRVPSGFRNAFAPAINAAGIAAGWANTTINPFDSFSTTHAIRFTAKAAEDIGTLPGGRNSAAYAINAEGVVAGNSDAGNSNRLGFRWHDGAIEALLPLSGGVNTSAFGINDSGHVAGVSDFRDPETQRLRTRAVIWPGDHAVDLHASAGDEESVAYALNSADEAVGRVNKDGANSAFLYSKDSITWLGVQGTAFSINDNREIVGVIDAPERSNPAGFLWREGKVFDLNDLVSGTNNIRIETAFAINAEGKILCLARFLKSAHLVLLLPQH